MHSYFNTDIDIIIQDLETFLSTLSLDKDWWKYKKIEEDLKGPLNPSPALDQFFFNEKIWLSFKDFFKYYLTKNETLLQIMCKNKNMRWEEFLINLEARIYRTHFGIYTEYNFFFMCQKIFGPESVKRNINYDLKGVDFSVYHNNIYNIHIFVDTPIAYFYREKKKTFKNSNQLTGIHIDLPYDKDNKGFIHTCKMLPNGFVVATETYIKYLKSEMEKNNIKNNNIISIDKTGFVYDSDIQNKNKTDISIFKPVIQEEIVEEWMTY